MLLSSYYNKPKGPKDGTHHMGKRKEYFNGMCNYYKKVGHEKVDCWKLKGKQENKGDDKSPTLSSMCIWEISQERR